MEIIQGAIAKSLSSIKENAPSIDTSTPEKLLSDLTGNKGENGKEDDNTGDELMETERETEKEKDVEKEAEITNNVKSWKDKFVHEQSNYHPVKISKRFAKAAIPAWCLNKEEQGKDKEEYHIAMMQMLGGFTYFVSQLKGGEKVVSSKEHNVFKYEESTRLWSPAEIENEFVCNYVEGIDGTISVQIMLYMDYGESNSFGVVKNKIFKQLEQEKLYFHTYDGTADHFNSTTTGFFVNLYPEAVNIEELREHVNLTILEHYVYNKDKYEWEIEQYNAPEFLPRVQVYRKKTETHLGRKGKRIMTDAICIDVPYPLRALFRKIVTTLYDGSHGLEFCDKTLKLDWRTKGAYNDLVTKHYKYLENHEIVRLQNLEQEELDSIDASLRAIKEVKKIYKATHFDKTGKCNVVVEKKFENLYVEKIDNILRHVVQNDNWKFCHPPNRAQNASEQISAKKYGRI